MAVMCQRSGIDPRVLPYGCLAIALYAAPDLPYPHRPEEDLMVYAEHGIEALGGVERVSELHEELLDLNTRWLSGQVSDYDYAVLLWLEGACAELPPNADRFDRCMRYDYAVRRRGG